MKRRLSRVKAEIKLARIPFAVPPEHLLPERLAAALAVIYLSFDEGYGGRGDLAAEAIRLGRVLAQLMPGARERPASESERQFLSRRLAELDSAPHGAFSNTSR